MIALSVPLEKILLVLSYLMVFLNLPSSKPAFAKKFVLRSSIPNILGTAAIKRDSSKILLKGKTGIDTSTLFETKVVTDIDDTVVSSGGLNIFGIALGGIDRQYKRGQFYPGVTQFALELSMLRNSLPSKVSVLTARAREFKFALALKSSGKLCSAYRSTGEVNGIDDWGIGDVYYGSVAEWIFQNRKGLRKFLNFEIMMQNDESLMKRDGKYIIIGDTGEKDEEAGERIASKYPNKVRAIFLHTVYKENNNNQLNKFTDRKVSGVPVFYFRTYIGAAVKAYRSNIIGREALKRVAERAIVELRTQQFAQEPNSNNPKSVRTLFHSTMKDMQSTSAQNKQITSWMELLTDLNEVPFLDQLKREVPPSMLQLYNSHSKTPSPYI
eukprot:gene22789-29508_t